MNIRDILNKSFDFTFKRLAELIGFVFIIASILFFGSLISYSPEDPNFIFPDNAQINNLLGERGSYVSDLFYQSIGLISILIPFSIFFTGLNVVKKKSLLLIVESFFL